MIQVFPCVGPVVGFSLCSSWLDKNGARQASPILAGLFLDTVLIDSDLAFWRRKTMGEICILEYCSSLCGGAQPLGYCEMLNEAE